MTQSCVQEGPRVVVPDGPGLGVEVDEERAVRSGYRPGQTRHLRRRDGSITNS